MREELARFAGSRQRFRGTFRQYGSRPVYRDFREPTLLLGEICLADGTPVCTHLWFRLTNRFLVLGDLQRGDLLEFTARAGQYHKFIVHYRRGRREAETDWHLTYPTEIRRIVILAPPELDQAVMAG